MVGDVLEGYIETAPNLWIKRGALERFKKIDSLVLDIDGVILDVTRSFRVAIGKATQFYFKKILKWPGDAVLITPSETQFFKMAGGFNNDWELTYAVIIFYLGKSALLSNRNLNVLRDNGQSLRDFTNEVKKMGGGLEFAERAALSGLKDKERIKALWDRSLIKQIFQEFYAGVDWCKRLYGFNPVYVNKRGLLNREKVLISRELVKQFYPKVSVITGRTKKETGVALERANLSGIIFPENVLSDDGGVRKPDPTLLVDLSKKMDTKVGIYIGDTPDDLETVNNFKKLGRNDKFLSCIVLRETEKVKRFIEGDVDVLAASGNDVLSEINKLKGD